MEETISIKGWKAYSDEEYFSSLSIYFMSLFVILKKVVVRLEKETFCGEGGALEQKPYLVNWAIVCLEKQKGGLGIRNLSIFNETLLGKWSWRFVSEKESQVWWGG